MSKEDAPNFTELEPPRRCLTCYYAMYGIDNQYFCSKYSILLDDDGDINVCDSWEYDK